MYFYFFYKHVLKVFTQLKRENFHKKNTIQMIVRPALMGGSISLWKA
jgi:hypothetical protein